MNDPALTEQDIMLSIWREAGRTGEGVTIPCSTEANAKRMRFALYNAIKPVKTGKLAADSALKEAVATCSLSFTNDKLGLVIRPKVSTELSQALIGALAGKQIARTEDLLLGESFARLSAIVPDTVPEPTMDLSKARSYGARG